MAEEEEGDGINIWGLLHAKYNKNTMTRLMRLQQESMYPKAVKTTELVGAIMAWEDKLKRMIRAKRDEDTRLVEDGGDVKVVPKGDPGHGRTKVG